MRCVVTWRSGNASAWMRPRAAQVESFDRCAILRPSWHRPHEKQLVQRKIAVKDITFRQSVGALQIKRRERMPCEDRARDIRGIFPNCAYDPVAQQFAMVVPSS